MTRSTTTPDKVSLHPFVIDDQATWSKFVNGESVIIHPVMTASYFDRIFRDDYLVEVWYKSIGKPNTFCLGKVVRFDQVIDNVNPTLIELKILK
jgi:hypothetical protein